MKIRSISIGYISIPLVTPFKTALRTVDSVNDLLVCVEADNGEKGYGEAPPTAVITGDTKESIEAAIRFYIAPTVQGMSIDSPKDLERLFTAMEKCIAKNTSAKAAVDIAVHDLYAKLQGQPLYRILAGMRKMPVLADSPKAGCGGGESAQRTGMEAVKTQFETDLTISVNEPDEMVRDSLRAKEEGFSILKVKVGKGGEKDVERIRCIREAVGREMIIRVDANQGWSREEAIRTIAMMEDALLDIELVEQPVSCHDFKGLKAVADAVETPILADESVFSVEDAERIIEEHAADLINIKLMKTGGIHNALKICDLAEANGVQCMAGCMLESKVSVSAAAHMTGACSCITMADLDGPSLCREDPYTGGPVYEGPRIVLPEEWFGIGITGVPVNWEKL